MTPQLGAAFKRSFLSAVPVALSSAGAVAVEIINSADPKTAAVTAGGGALATLATLFFRGVVEGLSDGQRAAVGNVLESDVQPVVNAVLPLVHNTISAQAQKEGIHVTPDQVDSAVKAVEADVKDVFAANPPSPAVTAAPPGMAPVTSAVTPAEVAAAPAPTASGTATSPAQG